MKTHKSGKSKGAAENSDDSDGEKVDHARASRLQQSRETRNQLKAQVGKAVQAVLQGASLFQMAVLNLRQEELQKKLELNVAERIKDSLVDKIADKFKEGVVEAAGVGKAVASRSMAVFGAIKGELSGRIQAQGELSVVEVAKLIGAGMTEKAADLERDLCDAIDGLSPTQILGIRKVLGSFDGIEDDADSPENGRLEDGLKDWAMTELIGIPAGDAVAAEEYAKGAMASFQEGVRSSMTAAEAGDAVQHRLANPNEDRDAIEGAEESMGPHFRGNLERDRGMRQRVAATGDKR